MKLSRFSVAAVVIAAFVAAEAFAQVGSVLGRLVDDQGNPVVDAECTIELSGGGGRRTKTKTKDDGSFVKPGLRPGVYTIRCEKEGYRPLPLQTQVSAVGQGDLGERVMFPLADGELSEKDHARATELLEGVQDDSATDEETLAKLLELHEMLPDEKAVVFNIAGTYESMGDTENAVKYYTLAADGDPELAYNSWVAIGDIHGKARAWADAAAAMKNAVDIKQTNAIDMFNYAVYAQNAGDAAAAKAAYEKVIEVDPNQAVAYYQLGMIAVGEMENDVALGNFEKFIALAPDHDRADEAQGVIDALQAAADREKQ